MASFHRLSRAARLVPARPFSSTRAPRFAYKDTQDRKSLRPAAAENTKTGRDQDVANDHPDAAFGSGTTSPEGQFDIASKGSAGANPLDASGANQPLSKPHGDEKTSDGNGKGKEVSKTGKASKATGAPKKGSP